MSTLSSQQVTVDPFKHFPKYKGSKTLRPAGIDLDYTADQALEMMQCLDDPVYFCKNYLKIRTPDFGLQPFNLRPYQETCIKIIIENKFSIMKWGRQPFTLDTPIHTTKGIKYIKNIKVGDYVYGAENNRVRVINKSQIYRDRKLFELFFESGEKIKCDADHLWLIDNSFIDTKTMYINFTSPLDNISYKDEIIQNNRIIDIQIIPSEPTICIETDAPDGLFLVGNDKILTSNSGKTTCVAAALVWLFLFNQFYEIIVLAHKEKQAKEILKRIKLYYELLPYWMQHGVTSWNATSVELETGSTIFAAASSPDSIRGASPNVIFQDEYAILNNDLAEELFTSSYPAISAGVNSKFIICSTPKGVGGKYYKIWKEAEKGTNGFVPFAINYWDVPGRDEEWAKNEVARIGQAKFDQEFGAEFSSSSNTLIDGRKIEAIQWVEPVMMDEHELLHIFKQPVPGTQYVITVDVSEGVGGDYSTFSVIDVSKLPYEIVCTYANDMITTLMFPNVIFDIATFYNKAFIVVEANTIGTEVANILHYDLEYENMLSTDIKSKRGEIDETPRSYVGIKQTKRTKHLGCSNLKLLVENDQLNINCYRVVYELARFIKKGNTFKAEDGEHDDLAMNLVLFSYLTTLNSFKELTNGDIRHTLNQRKMNEQLDHMPSTMFSNMAPEPKVQTMAISDFDRWMADL
jgi:hypothetical protein